MVPPAALRVVVRKTVETHQPRPTRAEHSPGTLTSQTDRVYRFSPGRLLLRMDVRACADKDLLRPHTGGISDHAPVFMRIAPKGRVPSIFKRIPQRIAATAEYERRLLSLERAAGLADLSSWDCLGVQNMLSWERPSGRADRRMWTEAISPSKEDRSMIAAARALVAGVAALMVRTRNNVERVQEHAMVRQGRIELSDAREG